MTDAPLLTAADLQEELRLIHRRRYIDKPRHRTLTTALYAQGEERELTVPLDDEGERRFLVKPVRCELELRKALSERSDDQPLLLLLDFAHERLAADLHGRLAAGRVLQVDRGRRIARLFGASAVSSELLACRPLCELLLEDGGSFAATFSGATVDLHSAWRAVLYRYAGLATEGDLSDERLLAHAASTPVTSVARQRLADRPLVAAKLAEHLERWAGAVAPVVWRAWLSGQGRRAAAVAFLLEVGASRLKSDGPLRIVITHALAAIDPALKDLPAKDRQQLLERWGQAAGGLRRRLTPSDLALAVLAEANDLITDDEVAESLSDSRYLPAAFDRVEKRLAGQLAQRNAITPERIKDIAAALDRLALHERADSEQGREIVLRARMALRLLAYRVARPNLEEQGKLDGSNGALFALAQHQVSDGAYFDFARDRARGPVARPLERAIDTIVSEADLLREQDDEAFARAYSGWAGSGSPPTQKVVPIARALDHFAVPFLKAKAHRRLLVILLDGMSWANAVELLQGCETEGYGVLRTGDDKLLPMLAALPSLTGVSRAALFGGKPIRAGETLDTSKDRERFATHAGMRKLGIENAQLYLKDQLETPSGDLNSKAIDLLRSADRVVGVVVNALDDQLKGARQVRVAADLAHIKPLGRLLTEATEANRAILLVADHGHVRTHRMKPVGRPGDGRRYRGLSEGEAPADNEIALDREVAWVERGKAKVALLYRESDSFGTATGTGEHGGLSLAEIVTPALLVGSERLRRQVESTEGVEDPELEIKPLPRPDWWELQFAKPRTRAAAAPATQSKTKVSAEVQPSLPFVPTAPVAVVLEVAESAWLRRLCDSKAFSDRSPTERKRWKEIVAPRVAVLADADGSLPSEVFAHKAGVLPRNVGGVVSEMQEWINFDGYLVVEYDPVSQRVALNRGWLDEYLKEFG